MYTYNVGETPSKLDGWVTEIVNLTTQSVQTAGIIESLSSVTAIVRAVPSVSLVV